MSDLQTQLQSAVGDNYRIEEELGGGGMSRVFLAEEVALGRRVVIKVLPPEMAVEVSKDRFQREIQLAAKLQHPHVVSLLTAGSADDLLYYVMPYIEGESLRSKLHREGELPVGEAVKILKEVIDALAYAHEQGVVHRDIKPDNVMISRRHALVTDFGVAKAVTTSGTGTSLTSLGIALGTPAYMAPEQAAADPHTDHRADIYAVGTLAYEMLTGEPPFTGATPQAVMGKHMTEAPQPVATRRPAVNDVLQSLVMRCLEKRPADRWQSAAELLPQLEALTTPSGGVTPTGTRPVGVASAENMLRKSAPGRVAALFGLTAVAVLAVTYILVMQLGLPYWVLSAAVILLAVSLPVVMHTGRAERRRASARLTGMVGDEAEAKSGRWLTWRKTLMGTGGAAAGLVLVTAVYMTMRVMGIGPAGTLITTGEIEEGALVILSDFTDHSGDSSLAQAVTGAFAADLMQSDILRLMQPGDVREALQRMALDPMRRLGENIALEMAARVGAGAVIAGDVNGAGSGYILTARLLAPETGNVMLAFRETAGDESEVIGAIDRLSKGFRARMGESLRSLRTSPRLARVTTSSLEALRRYTEANRAMDREGDHQRAIELLEEAVSIDTNFAAAYRKLGSALYNTGQEPTKRNAVISRAFELRDRLAPYERASAESFFHAMVRRDYESAVNAAVSYNESQPSGPLLLTNLGFYYQNMRRWEEAEATWQLALDTAGATWQKYAGLVRMQVAQGKIDAAARSMEQFAEQMPGAAITVAYYRALLASALGDHQVAERVIDSLRLERSENRSVRYNTDYWLTQFSLLNGQADDAERFQRDRIQMAWDTDRLRDYLFNSVDLAWIRAQFGADVQGALAIVDDAMERAPLDSLPPADRLHTHLANFYVAAVGRVDLARQLMNDYERDVSYDIRNTQAFRLGVAGKIALAEGHADDAISQFRAWDAEISNPVAALPDLARAYYAAGQQDSAIAVYERFLTTPWLNRYWMDSWELPPAHKRLGELYEARGDREKAVEHYYEFVELWQNADAELQPQVADVRERIARLVGEG